MTTALFEGCSDSEHTPRRTTSEEGIKMLAEAKNKTNKVILSYTQGEVLLTEGDKTLKVIDSFSPVVQFSKWHKSGGFKWEGDLCKLVKGLDLHEVARYLPFQKDRMQYYTYYLGVTPTRWLKMYNACVCKAFVPVELKDVARKLCRGVRGHYDKVAIDNLNKNKHIILQCIEDGMENIIPFFLFLSQEDTKTATLHKSWWQEDEDISVSGFRRKVGKGMWKRLLKNSMTRNKSLCFGVENTNDVVTRGAPEQDYSERFNFGHLQALPSSLLPRRRVDYICDEHVAKVLTQEKLLTKKAKHKRYIDTISDTKIMCNKLGYNLPKQAVKWDWDKWNERHDYYSEQLHLRNYSRDVFESVKGLNKQYTSECGNYTATLLDNAFDIKQEGETMKHCVASYSDRVRNGNYIILGVLDKEGSRSSTLGLHKNEEGVRLDQHYKHCNARVVDETEKAFATIIVEDLNKQLKTKAIKDCLT